MQPYFFPYIGYWKLMACVETFVVYDDVTYIKGGWINRNRLLINGKPSFITIPLDNPSSFQKICHTKIKGSKNWREKMLRTIHLNYCRTKYFKIVFETIEEIIEYQTADLTDYLINQLTKLSAFIGISPVLIRSSQSHTHLGGSGQERIIDLCRHEKALEYFNLPGGISLYDPGLFLASGIKLQFIDATPSRPLEIGDSIGSSLSIIDYLMHNGPVAAKLNLTFDQ